VLAVHREQAYVEQCVRSLLGAGDVEVVAVDDASPDHGPQLLDELASQDPRVVVRHLPERVGRGGARNAGLDAAAGEHVWFVDATDRLAPGALAAVLARLEAEDPDVLLVHHSRTNALGVLRAEPPRAAVASIAAKGPGPLDERAAGLAPRAWDKVFRRSLLDGTRFGPGRNDELTVTWPALLGAGRIAAIAEPVYVRNRPRNRDTSGPGSPHDIFTQCDAVLAAAPSERRPLIARAMLRHQLDVLNSLPGGERRAFFSAMSAAYPGGAPGRVARLVEGDRYAAYVALQRALERRRALGRRRNRLRRAARRAAGRARRKRLERYYAARRRQPIDPNLAVFAAYWYRSYACNPRAIYEKARELVPGMRGVWVMRPGALGELPDGVEGVVANTREYYDLIARAGVLVNNVNFPNHLVKRDGQVHVMTHHGTPLKKMGLDEQDSPVLSARKDFPGLLRRCARWDYSVSSNVFSTLIWERVYPLRYESIESGYPRNDVLVDATEEDVAAARAALGIEPGQTAVLYAPTHREQQKGAFTHVLDLARFADGLGPDHVLLVRTHYFYGADPVLRDLHRQGRIRDVAAHPSIEQLCLAADVLVTDYSSLMFDYAVLDRPIVVYAPDWEAYRVVRGTYFDLTAEPPGTVTRTEPELLEAFASGAIRGEDAERARAAFRTRFCSLEDGRAAERVVRRVWPSARAEVAPPTMAAL
jgi:CDP-glycerol glycerophosphotransferase